MTAISLSFAGKAGFATSYDQPDGLMHDLLRWQFEQHLDAREALVRSAPRSDFYNL